MKSLVVFGLFAISNFPAIKSESTQQEEPLWNDESLWGEETALTVRQINVPFLAGLAGLGLVAGALGSYAAAKGPCRCSIPKCDGAGGACECLNNAAVACWVKDGGNCQLSLGTCRNDPNGPPTDPKAQFPPCSAFNSERNGYSACNGDRRCAKVDSTCNDFQLRATGGCIGICIPKYIGLTGGNTAPKYQPPSSPPSAPPSAPPSYPPPSSPKNGGAGEQWGPQAAPQPAAPQAPSQQSAPQWGPSGATQGAKPGQSQWGPPGGSQWGPPGGSQAASEVPKSWPKQWGPPAAPSSATPAAPPVAPPVAPPASSQAAAEGTATSQPWSAPQPLPKSGGGPPSYGSCPTNVKCPGNNICMPDPANKNTFLCIQPNEVCGTFNNIECARGTQCVADPRIQCTGPGCSGLCI